MSNRGYCCSYNSVVLAEMQKINYTCIQNTNILCSTVIFSLHASALADANHSPADCVNAIVFHITLLLCRYFNLDRPHCARQRNNFGDTRQEIRREQSHHRGNSALQYVSVTVGNFIIQLEKNKITNYNIVELVYDLSGLRKLIQPENTIIAHVKTETIPKSLLFKN